MSHQAPRPSSEDVGSHDAQHALHVVASFYDHQVEETFFARGLTRDADVVLGGTDALAIPVPKGSPYVARCTWTGARQMQVTDGLGREHTLDPSSPVTLRVGPVTLELSLVARFSLRRTGESAWWEALPFLSAVLASLLLAPPVYLFEEHRCEWLAGLSPDLDAVLQCDTSAGGGLTGSLVTSEYLARLLREDYAGEDQGVVDEIDRESGDRHTDSFYMPAGNDGPITDMGGAADVGEEIRAPAPEDLEETTAPEEQDADAEKVLAIETGTPVDVTVGEAPEDVRSDAVADADLPVDDEAVDAQVTPEEDHEGWGVQDWYDEQDQLMEQVEIDAMMRYATQRLRVDPNDPDALSILSYYQYLAEDFGAALATYDKYIAQLPESAAGYNNKALIYKRQGDFETEERLYRVALALEPDDVTALNNLAVCLAHQERFQEALDILSRLEVLDPDDPYADLHRAKVHAAMGEDEEVYFYLEKSLHGMAELDTLHHIEFRQDIRVDPAFEKMRRDPTFRAILVKYYGKETPLQP